MSRVSTHDVLGVSKLVHGIRHVFKTVSHCHAWSDGIPKRTETVRPKVNERCERRRECDSVLSATNDENDVELHGETDAEDWRTEKANRLSRNTMST